MREGLIKITGEDNLFYDSIKKEYKWRMHCPYCGKFTGVWCYPDFDSIPIWQEEQVNKYCSDVHYVLTSDECKEIAREMGITVSIKMEEWNASKIIKIFSEDIEFEDIEFEDISGQECTL